MSTTTIALSGGCDPCHIGHIRMIEEAHGYGDVYIILNSDEWLKRKKGYVFMPWEQRAEILRAIRWVTDVISVDDSDNSVCQALRDTYIPHQGANNHFTWFGNGGDRKEDNVPEVDICNNLGIKLAWNLGGSKASSSSQLVTNARNAEQTLVKDYKQLLVDAANSLMETSLLIGHKPVKKYVELVDLIRSKI